ncbi:MAG TPA: hypothetical protein VFA20_16040 [Myxococcaceae bacterium]|nr:hypothetical protein [Myxococcaceae bacterium]
MSDAREQANVAADRMRDDLLTTLKELDRRRLQATDWRYQVQAHQGTLIIAASAVAGVVALGVGLVMVRRHLTARRQVRRRWEALGRAWKHPERIATRADDAPGYQQLLRKALLAFGVALATRAGKRAAVSMVPTKPRQPGEPYLH